MKFYKLAFNNKILGVRVLFPVSGIAYDITVSQFNKYFQSVDKTKLRLKLLETKVLNLIDTGSEYKTQDEIDCRYRVISKEDDNFAVNNIVLFYCLDLDFDVGKYYVYIGRHDAVLKYEAKVKVIDIDIDTASCDINLPQEMTYGIGVQSLRKIHNYEEV